MSATKTTHYGGDLVMCLINKIIKNKKIELLAKYNVGSAHGFMVLKPCARPPKQPMVLLYKV